MRSGYKLLLPTLNVNPLYRQLFKKLWVVNYPSKIRFALWKCVRTFIPTKACLFSRRIALDSQCR